MKKLLRNTIVTLIALTLSIAFIFSAPHKAEAGWGNG
ncbi:Uncharacterised protein [Listeria grayi]|nr:Uncharacterised protein [Listeria grayi]